MKTPMDLVLESVIWEEIPSVEPIGQENLPFVTHEGVLRIGDLVINVYRLSNGQAVIDAEGMEKFMQWLTQ